LSEEREIVSYVAMRVDEKTHVYISINQKDKSSFEENIAYKPSSGRLLLFRMNEKDEVVGYVGGTSGFSRDFHFESVLDPGSYLIAAEMDWLNNIPQDFIVSAYGDKFVDLVNFKREK